MRGLGRVLERNEADEYFSSCMNERTTQRPGQARPRPWSGGRFSFFSGVAVGRSGLDPLFTDVKTLDVHSHSVKV